MIKISYFQVPTEMNDQPLNDFNLGCVNDDYCTVIYNDEFHRFDDVIDTIPRAVDCDRNTAIGLTTLVDRNGRCIVKCSGFANCQDVKKTAERTSRYLLFRVFLLLLKIIDIFIEI